MSSFHSLFGDALKDLHTLKFHTVEGWLKWRLKKRLAIAATLAVYIAVVAISSSETIAIAGGILVLALRLWAIEDELFYRLVFIGDLAIVLHDHTQASIGELGEALSSGGREH